MLDFLMMLDCLTLDCLMLDWLMIDYLPDILLIQSGDRAKAKLKGYYTHKHAGISAYLITYLLL